MQNNCEKCILEYNYKISKKMDGNKSVSAIQNNQLFEQAEQSLNELHHAISDADTDKLDKKFNIQLELMQKLSHSLHDIKQYCHDLALLQVNSMHQAKQAKQQLKKSRTKLQNVQNMYQRLSKNYQSACAQVIDKDIQISQLKQLNKIEISFIPSINLQISMPVQKQEKNSTAFLSSDYDPDEIVQDCDEISHRLRIQKRQQKLNNDESGKQQLCEQQKQKTKISKSLDIYNLLLQIEAMDIQSAQQASLSQISEHCSAR